MTHKEVLEILLDDGTHSNSFEHAIAELKEWQIKAQVLDSFKESITDDMTRIKTQLFILRLYDAIDNESNNESDIEDSETAEELLRVVLDKVNELEESARK